MFFLNLSTRQLVTLISATVCILIVANAFILFGLDAPSKVLNIALPGQEKVDPDLPKLPDWDNVNGDYDSNLVEDRHPIHRQTLYGDKAWDLYQEKGKAVSQNFSTIVMNYRSRYGRSPPPGFDKWYKFARARKVEILGDFSQRGRSTFEGPFQQIMDDMRPFWGVDPKVIRSLAGRMHDTLSDGIVGVHIRDGAVIKVNEGSGGWRTDSFVKMIQSFVKDLPDMDIAVNKLNKPRVTVPWDDLQKLLKLEEESRSSQEHTKNEFTKHLSGLWDDTSPKDTVVDPEWTDQSNKPYMSLVKEACPPSDAPDTGNMTEPWALIIRSIVVNHNASYNLCNKGYTLSSLHTMLYSPSDVRNTIRLVPIFSEGKTNVNNDILYPSGLYWDASKDGDYAYDDKYDYTWEDKHDTMYWRGTMTALPEDEQKWTDMQRERLVQFLGGTVGTAVIGTDPLHPNKYNKGLLEFKTAKYAAEHTDAKFVRGGNCGGRNCTDLEHMWEFQNTTTLAEQFRSKYLLDVDGDGFSPRFRALLQSGSLPIKSTIFKEWHTSRLFAWVHYVPLFVDYNELYSLLTYFVGYGNAEGNEGGEDWVNKDVYVQRHDFEGRRIAKRGREWAQKVLRREDMEVYMYRLLLEYGRIIDDNRDSLGYTGDGSEVDESKWTKLVGFGS